MGQMARVNQCHLTDKSIVSAMVPCCSHCSDEKWISPTQDKELQWANAKRIARMRLIESRETEREGWMVG